MGRLLPVNPKSPSNTAFPSEELLKLYTIVFDYCVGNGAASEKKLSGKFGTLKYVFFHLLAFMFGEELYKAVVGFINVRFQMWFRQVIQKA